jgi:hypothetical protein
LVNGLLARSVTIRGRANVGPRHQRSATSGQVDLFKGHQNWQWPGYPNGQSLGVVTKRIDQIADEEIIDTSTQPLRGILDLRRSVEN